MIKRISSRFLSLILTAVLLLSLIPVGLLTVNAATSGTVAGLTDTNIGLSFSGTGDSAWTASVQTVTGKVTTKAGTCSDTSYNSTLTVKNTKDTAAVLSFGYTVVRSSGTVTVAGTTISTDGTYSYSSELAAGGTIDIYIKSGSSSAATSITLSNISLAVNVTATTTFKPSENGSYTVDGTEITEETSKTQSALTAYSLVATPATGYKLFGWYNVTTGKYISFETSAALNIEEDCTITAKFVTSTTAIFETGGSVFSDLNEAVTYDQANSLNKITLIGDGTITGDYTIPSGITLLIPFDAAKTVYTTTPGTVRASTTSTAYRTLTMAEGSSITVDGAISIGGTYYAAGGGASGYVTGPYGSIQMAADSSITLKSGGAMYAWGFVSGKGTVTAESGSTVYEWFQIADFRGGTASSTISSSTVFPFSQYYVQDIEVPLTINAGAKENVYTAIYAASSTYPTSISFIGDDGMFKISSGSVTKAYDGSTDRLVFTVNGEMELNSLSLSLMGISVSSADYVLPITNNISLNIQSGKLTINQTSALQAGVQVSVANGADLVVSSGKSVYIYDRDEWIADSYCISGKFRKDPYAPSRTYTRTEADLKDVVVDVNGTVTAIGSIYTTAGGADICSSEGTGVYVQQGAPGTETVTYQYNTSTEKKEIAITAAKLHNADGSYTESSASSAGSTIYYADGRWGNEPPAKLSVTFNANGGSGTMASQQVTSSVKADLTANAFTYDHYTFKSWNTEPTGTGTEYADGAEVKLTQDTVLYAQWDPDVYTVIWADSEGNTLETDSVTYNTMPVYDGTTPAKEGYTFMGWTPDVTVATGNTTYTAKFEQNGWRLIGTDYYYYKDGKPVTGVQRVEYPSEAILSGYSFDAEDKEVNTGETAPYYVYPDSDTALFVFDENGVFQKDKDGQYDDNGVTRWIENGQVIWHAGLVYDGTDYYYFKRSGIVKSQETYVSKTNGLLSAATYTFDSDGKLQKLEGLNNDMSGDLCYYVNYVKNYAGLVQVDGNYYYIASDLKAVKNVTYYVTKTNGLLDAGYYTFDENGKMEIKEGLVEENGDLYYYENNAKVYKGLVQVDGDYYYISSTLKAVKSEKHYVSEAKANGLMTKGWYWFGDDGKMFLTGIKKEGDTSYYYSNGVRTYAGLIQIGEDYYYVRSDCSVVSGRSYYVTKTNGLITAGTYEIDTDGKLVMKNGIYQEGDYLFYYVNNVRQVGTGLTLLEDGSYIYVRSGANLAVGNYYVTNTNGLMAQGTYSFGDDGKMVK